MVESVIGKDVELDEVVARLVVQLESVLPGASIATSYECRYAGQSHELRVATPAAFHDEHERRNGYRRDGSAVEVVAVRASATRPSPVAIADLSGGRAEAVRGPAVVAYPDCTVWVPGGWHGLPGVAGALIIRRAAG